MAKLRTQTQSQTPQIEQSPPAVIAPSSNAQPILGLPTISDNKTVEPMNFTMTGFMNKDGQTTGQSSGNAALSDNDRAIAQPSAADMVVDIDPVEQS